MPNGTISTGPAPHGWRRLDPRRSLAAAIGWTMFVLVMGAALLAAVWTARAAESDVRGEHERRLGVIATEVAESLGSSVETRRAIVRATAAQIVSPADREAHALRRHLRALQERFPELEWMGVALPDGALAAAIGKGPAAGARVADEAWFAGAADAPWTGWVSDGASASGVLLAAPLAAENSARAGVLAARLAWPWLIERQARLLPAAAAVGGAQWFLLGSDGVVLSGPREWLGRRVEAPAALAEEGEWIVGAAQAVQGGGLDGLGWRVLLRERAAPVRALSLGSARAALGTVLAAGLLAALLAVLLTRRLTARLGRLASDAAAVQSGQMHSLGVPAGRDEVAAIGAVLAQVVTNLQQEKAALVTLNAELDARVTERTARIERLAEDARHAAVARERLRLARELHATLAHSLMALLTQIRLIRKLRARLDVEALDAELARAEQVAADGLADTRAAIAQMRHNDVREVGLATALQELLRHFAEHTGVAVTFDAAPPAASLADERAQTLFRVVEEALHNVERHADAARVRVTLGATAAGRARLVIDDDGVGFDPTQPTPGHYGLAGVREQAALVGATLGIETAPGAGCRITLEFDVA